MNDEPKRRPFAELNKGSLQDLNRMRDVQIHRRSRQILHAQVNIIVQNLNSANLAALNINPNRQN